MQQHIRREGFTLIELVMVIALLAMIATLAISRLSGVKADSAAKLNLSNLSRIGNIFDTYAAVNENAINRLDNLFAYGTPDGTGGSFADAARTDNMLGWVCDDNQGLDPALTNVVSSFGATFSPILGTYHLSAADVEAFRAIGLTYVMRATDGNRFRTGDDHAWAPDDSTNDADRVSCVATTVTNGLAVALVNPCAVSAAIQPVGAWIYQSCGQDVVFSTDMRVYVDGNPAANNAAALDALRNGSGVLLAFGLGQYASLVGDNRSGFADAPVCPVVDKTRYRRYLVLFRLAGSTANPRVEFAGVMDPQGNVAPQLRANAK